MTAPTPDLTPLRRLATAKEIAEALGLPLSRVYELARRGDLPAVRLGRAFRFDPVQIADFIHSGGSLQPKE